MKLQYLERVSDRNARPLTKEKFYELVRRAAVGVNVNIGRRCLEEGNKEGYAKAKALLPAVQWVGYDAEHYGTDAPLERRASALSPTQLFMVDIDHMNFDPRFIAEGHLNDVINCTSYDYKIRLIHVTPSGKGLRIVAECTKDFPTVIEHMNWFVKEFELEQFGDYDAVCKDFSRLSFLVPESEILFIDDSVFEGEAEFKPITTNGAPTKTPKNDEKAAEVSDSEWEEPASYEEYRTRTFRGVPLVDIASAYVKEYGEPGEGERHNYYNEMVKNFRTIADNNPLVLHAVLPRFGHTAVETLSQCQSICRTNTLSRIPKDFYFFLKDNGYYSKRKTASEVEAEQAAINAPIDENTLEGMPPLPPVFREIIGTMPKDFKIPGITGLLPILGTLTSHLRAEYPYDLRMHSTEFFSIIYAPSGTGKSFLERHMDYLFEGLKMRDLLCDERENLFNRLQNRKSSNDKGPDNPRVTKRISVIKQSESDFLEKQQANAGHHMFTYAPEMDAWRKGVKAAGGNKDDMLRIAWDNGEYGQSFKSANSFKGTVNLYWNVLICGTEDQLDAYFKNVENGLVGRCGFAAIENQEFVDAPMFKKLRARDMRIINAFIDRCDAGNYKEPLEFTEEQLFAVDEKDFDKEVPWRYQWQTLKEVDLSWLMPTINDFLRSELAKSKLDRDNARDSFRKRAAVRGFRLGLLCTELWKNVGERERKVIRDFVAWWMPQDLEQVMKLYGDRYNEAVKGGGLHVKQKGVFDLLGETFTREEVYAAVKRAGKKTKPRRVIFDWLEMKAIKEGEKEGTYVKILKKK